jgi:CMP-N-acetylneuraminic acid synthetase
VLVQTTVRGASTQFHCFQLPLHTLYRESGKLYYLASKVLYYVEGRFVLAHLYYTISLFPVATTYTIYVESGKLYYLASNVLYYVEGRFVQAPLYYTISLFLIYIYFFGGRTFCSEGRFVSVDVLWKDVL